MLTSHVKSLRWQRPTPASNKYHYLYVDIIHLCTSIAPAACCACCCACGWLLRLRLAAVPEEAIARQYICIELLLFVQAAEAAQLAHDVAARARLMELFRLIIELVRIYNNTGRGQVLRDGGCYISVYIYILLGACFVHGLGRVLSFVWHHAPTAAPETNKPPLKV